MSCECSGPGYCPKHKMEMSEKLWYRCQHKATLKEKAIGFAESVVGHIADGAKNLTPEQTEIRLQICYECPKYKENGTCSICGCRLKVKARWVSGKCPLGKW